MAFQIRKRKVNSYPTVGIPTSVVEANSSNPRPSSFGATSSKKDSTLIPSRITPNKSYLPSLSGTNSYRSSQSKTISDLSELMAECCLGCDQNYPQTDRCKICMKKLSLTSTYSDSVPGIPNSVIRLSRCGHYFHNQCLRSLIKSDASFFKCPSCGTCYGDQAGLQPDNGTMNVSFDNSIGLAGYEECDTILVTYSFTSGVSGGRSYSAIGFPCTAYFPANKKGEMVVKLLQKAFEKRLVFCIDTSNNVVLNGIEHKTSWSRDALHGYPDSEYLDRVLDSLYQRGIF